jgi:ABC-type hemin transport system ATPase subunit
MAEHRLEILSELCPRVVAMVSGRVIADGTPDHVFNRDNVQERVGLPAYTQVARGAGLPAPWPVRLTDSVEAFQGEIA